MEIHQTYVLINLEMNSTDNCKFANMKEIVVSGIRPTGKLHLGNYFGAFKKLSYTSRRI